MSLSRNGLIVLISIIFVAGAGTAYAGLVLPTITLAGNVQVDGSLNVDRQMTGPTITAINNQLAKANDKFLITNKAVEIPPGTFVPGCEDTNSCFIPFSTKLQVGGNVLWTNFDTAAHTVTSGTPGGGTDGLFDSSLILPGNTFSHQFTQTGTFQYFCQVHPWQLGEVIVTTPSNNRIVANAPGSSVPGCEDTNSCFIPFSTKLQVGGNVLWTNFNTAAHTVTSGTPGGGPDGLFDSSLIPSGGTFSHQFTQAGTIPYFCLVHPWMTGQVLVAGQTAQVSISLGSSVFDSLSGCHTDDTCFVPSTVILLPGGSVTWFNDDTASHTVTSGTPGGGPDGVFDCGTILPGNSCTINIDAVGTFEYFDTLHQWAMGTVIVANLP